MGTATSGVRRRQLTASLAPRRAQSNAWARALHHVAVPLPAGAAAWLHRALNFTLALLALLALLPVFVLLALLIKLTSRGPVFYLQERVGLDRRGPGPEPHN
ncbi:MAG TPA: sugar transferase, partial [Gemmatimonadales bacterium]|nr:sugar transferase [Gemmatimonadales bacterium]